MEKAVLKTLIYYNIFDFPLKAWEVQKWLIGRTASLKQVEKTLRKLRQESTPIKSGSRIKNQGSYYFLTGRRGLVKERLEKENISKKHLKIAKVIVKLFKIIPWVKLVGISGSLSMMGNSKSDDIDLFIITSKNRIWLSRFFLIILTSLSGLRRKRRENKLSAAGKLCINLILETDNLGLSKSNIYLAHEVLQMKVLWQRDEIYSKFLHDNFWAFKYLPNWKSGEKMARGLPAGKAGAGRGADSRKQKTSNDILNWVEELAKSLQLKIMNSPTGDEKIDNGALYFHPEDKGVKIMQEYKRRSSSFL